MLEYFASWIDDSTRKKFLMINHRGLPVVSVNNNKILTAATERAIAVITIHETHIVLFNKYEDIYKYTYKDSIRIIIKEI